MFRVSVYFEDVMESFVNLLNSSNLRKVEKAADLVNGTYMVTGNDIFIYSNI